MPTYGRRRTVARTDSCGWAARYGIMEILLTEQSSHVKIAKVRRSPTPGFFKLQKNFLDLEGTVVIHYKGSLT